MNRPGRVLDAWNRMWTTETVGMVRPIAITGKPAED